MTAAQVTLAKIGGKSKQALKDELSLARSETEITLEELLRRCLLESKEELWTEFVRLSQRLIACVITKSIRGRTKFKPDLIDDLVQETYLKLFAHNFKVLRRFVPRHEKALCGFLKVVASNTVRDHFRSANNQKHGRGISDVQLDSVSCHDRNRMSKAMEREMTLRAVDKCLADYACSTNSARDYLVFWLYYGDGWTASEISQLGSIGLTVKGVESLILRMVRYAQTRFAVAPSARQPGPIRCRLKRQ